MDCNQSELYMMQHFEKTIEPKNAKALAEHVLTCDSCRELYLTMDEAMDGFELVAAPDNFTESVMGKVRELPVYSKPAVAISSGGVSIVLRILWGISAIMLGVGLFFIFNPDLFTALAGSYSAMESVINALSGVGTAMVGAFEWLAQVSDPAAAGNLSIIALLFVAVTGSLLYVLHSGNSDKSALHMPPGKKA